MRAVLQRAAQASVSVAGQEVGRIGPGLLVLLGIEDADTQADIDWLAAKLSRLRIFDDAEGVMNLSLAEVDGEALVVSQFTLHASTRKGNRPSYTRAARPEVAEPMYLKFVDALAQHLGKPVPTGRFGAHMQVSLVNDGPVTLLIDTQNKE